LTHWLHPSQLQHLFWSHFSFQLDGSVGGECGGKYFWNILNKLIECLADLRLLIRSWKGLLGWCKEGKVNWEMINFCWDLLGQSVYTVEYLTGRSLRKVYWINHILEPMFYQFGKCNNPSLWFGRWGCNEMSQFTLTSRRIGIWSARLKSGENARFALKDS
jgi:hypothetical protein